MSIVAAIAFLLAGIWIKSLNLSKAFYWRLLTIGTGCFLVVLASCCFPFYALSPHLRFIGVTKSGPYRDPGQLSIQPQDPRRKTLLTVDHVTNYDLERRYFVTSYFDSTRRPSTLILVPTAGDRSWGRKNHDTSDRTFEDFLKMIIRQQLSPQDISLGLLTSSEAALEKYTALLLSSDIPIALIQIIFAPDGNFSVGPTGLKESGNLRNILTEGTLQNEKHVVWIDPDIDVLPDRLFNRFYEISKAPITNFDVANVPDEGKRGLLPLGVATLTCKQTRYSDLARNAWSGPSRAELKHAQGSYRECTPQIVMTRTPEDARLTTAEPAYRSIFETDRLLADTDVASYQENVQ
ncbi:hypothetical protein Dda_2263 [Drechslerella dactyloides]|uniref:Uncharacterized protein n=1 Tax=Drechslerella dactyloides TaxID=74499 RepID=A0AAD6NM56_DREDA|nr:hypothetical protein Dda_2263 [Drechslerella dactyloides]